MKESNSKPKLIAHRGEQNEAPSNTVEAFLIAAKRNYWGVEADIQKTADGEYVCIHNSSIRSMTNGSGRTTKLTLAEIRSFNIDNGEKYYKYKDLKVPTLEEFLEVMKEYSVVPVLDLKFDTLTSRDMIDIFEKVKKFGLLDRAIFATMSRRLINALRDIDSGVNIQYSVFRATKKDLEYCARRNCDISALSISKNRIRQAQEMGVKVNIWTLSHKPKVRLSDKEVKADFATANIRDLVE